MALCLPRKRRATSLATRPRTLSVASITNHSCVTSAGFALNVFMSLFRVKVWRVLFRGRRSSDGNLLGGLHAQENGVSFSFLCSAAEPQGAAEPAIIRKIKDLAQGGGHHAGGGALPSPHVQLSP